MSPEPYPRGPATGKTDTSVAASEAMAIVTARVQRAVLREIRRAPHGMTVHELATALGMERSTVQPRFFGLKAIGFICDSGTRRRNPNGKNAIVWTAVGGVA